MCLLPSPLFAISPRSILVLFSVIIVSLVNRQTCRPLDSGSINVSSLLSVCHLFGFLLLRFLFVTLCVWCFLWLLWYLLGRQVSNSLCQGLIASLALFGWRCFHQLAVIQPVCGGSHGRINVEPLFSIFPNRGSYYMLPPFFVPFEFSV